MCNVYTPHWSTVNFVSENGCTRSAQSRRFSAPTPTKENTPMFGELIHSASLSVTFAFVVSRLAQQAWRTLKPPHRTRTRADVQRRRPGTPLPPVLTSRTGGRKLRAVRWIRSKTHSSVGKSVQGPPLDTGSKCRATGGTWKQAEVKKEREFSDPRRCAGFASKVRGVPLPGVVVLEWLQCFLLLGLENAFF